MAAQPLGKSREERSVPLFLLHGGGPGVDAASNWRTVSDELAATFTCFAPDLLGFGETVADQSVTGVAHGPAAWAQRRARQVLNLMDRHGVRRTHLLGNSAAGGAAALAIMTIAPERVERAVLMGGAGTGPRPSVVPFYDQPTQESMRATLTKLVADEGDHQELLDELAPRRLAQALRPWAETAFRSMFEPDPTDIPQIDASCITCPVLVLHGEQDHVSAIEVSKRLADALPQGRLQVVEGAGHWIHVDRPAEFCRQVEEFLTA
jgi:2-hydroxymuconate-semialdehyde hydrolase